MSTMAGSCDNPAMRCPVNSADLGLRRGAVPQQTGEKIPVPDTKYDTEFWREHDGGVGGRFGPR